MIITLLNRVKIPSSFLHKTVIPLTLCGDKKSFLSNPLHYIHFYCKEQEKEKETETENKNEPGKGTHEKNPTLDAEILRFLEEIDDLPSVDDLIHVVETCKRSKNVNICKRLHVQVCNCGLESHKVIGNNIVQMFVGCGSFTDAHHVFSILSEQNICTWTCLMLGYIQYDDVSSFQAIDLYEKMNCFKLHPNCCTFVALLKTCISLNDLNRGRDAHREIICRGFEEDLFIGSTLVDMYGKCQSLQEAEDVFLKLPIRNVVSWSALILAYIEHGYAHEALECFKKMQYEDRVSPDTITYIAILKACGCLKDMHEAHHMHNAIINRGLERERHMGNCLIDTYAKCGSLQEACQILTKLPFRDVVSWTALFTGYSEHGSDEDLLQCFDIMQMEGISPDVNIFASVLKVCGKIGAINKGREIHRLAERKTVDRELFLCSALVDMYAKCGSLVEAREAFDKLPIRDNVSWNVLISGYAEHGPYQEAITCFARMRTDNVWQGVVTFMWCIKACGNMGAFDKGREMHFDSVLRGFDRDPSLSSSLLDMYAKLSLLLDARYIFEKLESCDVTSWNTMIKAYGINQQSEIAISLFKRMREVGVKSDAATFSCFLKACSRASLIRESCEVFRRMVEENMCTNDHMSCMLDVLARAGLIEEARKLLQTVPCSPSSEVWRILLTGCKTHTDMALL